MSALDDLKSGVVIDASGSTVKSTYNGQEMTDKVDPAARRGHKQFVHEQKPATPTGQQEVETPVLPKKSKSTTKTVVDISQIAKPDAPDPTIKKGDPIDEMLIGPNSMFEKYRVEHNKEMDEMASAREQEEELKKELGEDKEDDADDSDENEDQYLLDEDDASNGENIDTTVTKMDENIVIDDDLDIESSDEEDQAETEEFDTDEETDDSVSEDSAENAETIENTESVKEIVSEEKKPDDKKKDEPKYVDAPDIDITESTETDEVDLEDNVDEEDDEGDEDVDESLKHLQKLATERLKPVSKSLDISSFTVVKKASASNLRALKTQDKRVIKWVLPNQEAVVLMKEFLGSELETLREASEETTSVTSLTTFYKMIYEHIASPKPASFDVWLKTTPFSDIDHYFFAIYIASFKGANFLPVDCQNPNCKETYLTEDVNLMDMVKFDNEEAKEKFENIYKSEELTPSKGLYCTERVPLNSKVAVSFKEPSIYNLFEVASIDSAFRKKHSTFVEYMPYIDSVYLIDMENHTLAPVQYKTYPDSAQKTTKSKIVTFDSILKTLSVDEFGPIKAYVRAVSERDTAGMHYVFPSTECPKCHQKSVEAPVSAQELVFTRYQLGALTNTVLR